MVMKRRVDLGRDRCNCIHNHSGYVSNRGKYVLLIIGAVLLVIFVILPVFFSLFDGSKIGNVALIPIEGPITVNGGTSLGSTTVSSQKIREFIEDADKNKQVKVIVLEINSPGGSAVASDEIASAVKNAEKPVVALIREVGASGGYWVASSADYVIANRMSITGSIGVISSYLGFSRLMEEYGVSYERLVAGEYKDLGSPLKKLEDDEKTILQGKLDKIHQYFIEEIAANRKLEVAAVEKLATGEFFLGMEAYHFGLVDELGDKQTVEKYLETKYAITKPDYVIYEQETSLLDLFAGVFSDFFFQIGEGFGSTIIKTKTELNLMMG